MPGFILVRGKYAYGGRIRTRKRSSAPIAARPSLSSCSDTQTPPQFPDIDFEKQLHARLEFDEQEKHRAIALAETKAAGELQKATAGASMFEHANLADEAAIQERFWAPDSANAAAPLKPDTPCSTQPAKP